MRYPTDSGTDIKGRGTRTLSRIQSFTITSSSRGGWSGTTTEVSGGRTSVSKGTMFTLSTGRSSTRNTIIKTAQDTVFGTRITIVTFISTPLPHTSIGLTAGIGSTSSDRGSTVQSTGNIDTRTVLIVAPCPTFTSGTRRGSTGSNRGTNNGSSYRSNSGIDTATQFDGILSPTLWLIMATTIGDITTVFEGDGNRGYRSRSRWMSTSTTDGAITAITTGT